MEVVAGLPIKPMKHIAIEWIKYRQYDVNAKAHAKDGWHKR